jgi:hypothetical protein
MGEGKGAVACNNEFLSSYYLVLWRQRGQRAMNIVQGLAVRIYMNQGKIP